MAFVAPVRDSLGGVSRKRLMNPVDLHEYLGGANIMPTTPHPITHEKVPLTMGHEFSGIVEEVGEGVHDMKVGERVVVQPIIYDGTCGACKAGFINCCDKNGFVGLSGKIQEAPEERTPTSELRLGRWALGARGHSSQICDCHSRCCINGSWRYVVFRGVPCRW